AFELNVPIAHKVGARFEYVHKKQSLLEDDITNTASDKLVKLGAAELDGYAFYGQLWVWAIGDDKIIGDPGLQLPPRLKGFSVKPPKHGLMLTARADYLNETVTSDAPALKDPSVGTTRIFAPEFGANYWY